MSNKTQLQTNNASLEEYITRINAAKEVAAGLPEAGGGGSVETSNVTIAASVSPVAIKYSPTLGEATLWQADEPGSSAQIECVKGTIIQVVGNGLHTRSYVGCEYIGGDIVLITESVARIE
jgi:hypothetical protein